MAGNVNRQILLKSRPEGPPGLDNFELAESPIPRAGRGRGAHAHRLSLARPLHARPHERRAVLRQAGRRRAADGRRHRRRDRQIAQSEILRRRYRRRTRRLAGIRAVERRGPAQARSGGGAGLDRARRARHAGDDRLCRPARDRPAQARGNGRGRRRLRRGRVGGRADRQDQGMPRRRDRGRRREMPLRRARSSVSMPASIIALPILRNSSRRRVPRASMSISRMSAAPCSIRSGRCSTISPAFRCAG